MKAGEEPERATFPFVMANAAQAMDVEAAVILQGNGVYLAKKGYVDDITFCRDDQRQIYGGLLKWGYSIDSSYHYILCYGRNWTFIEHESGPNQGTG